MPSDSAKVGTALVTLLAADATLVGMLGGPYVYKNSAPQGLTRFALVRLMAHLEEAVMPGETGFEVGTYLVKVVLQSTSKTEVAAAALRVHALLHYQNFSIPDHALMVSKRREFIEYDELDDVNRAWQHCGGTYDLWTAPTN